MLNISHKSRPTFYRHTRKYTKSSVGISNKIIPVLKSSLDVIPYVSPSRTTSTHNICTVPHIYLNAKTDTMFQVSLNNPKHILFKNKTKNSFLDCGYKALAAIGLRNKYMALINSSMVNKRGISGINSGYMSDYLAYIYDLPDNSVEFEVHEEGYLTTTKFDLTNEIHRYFKRLQNNHATIFLVGLETDTMTDDAIEYDKFGHYMVAYRDGGTVYYYNPQTNKPNRLTNQYMSTDLYQLLLTLYPGYRLTEWGIFMVYARGTPKPVINKRLKSYLQFAGSIYRH